MYLVSCMTEDYVHRTGPYLNSLSNVTGVTKVVACVGFQPSLEIKSQYPDIDFRHMELPASHSFGMVQHGCFLEVLQELKSDELIILSDMDIIIQRDFTPGERKRFSKYDGQTIGMALNMIPIDTLKWESQRLNLSEKGVKDFLLEPEMEYIHCYNCGVMVAQKSLFQILKVSYEIWCESFYAQTSHRSRCQFLINWCIQKEGFRIDCLLPEFHSHGHHGIPEGCSIGEDGIFRYGSKVIMFRHKA